MDRLPHIAELENSSIKTTQNKKSNQFKNKEFYFFPPMPVEEKTFTLI